MVEKIKEERICPSAIATSYTGKAKRAVKELKDIIFPHDPEAEVLETRFRDVILIYTVLDKESLKNLMKKMRPSALARFVVADKCIILKNQDEILRLTDVIEDMFIKYRGAKFYVDCIKRGDFIDSCHRLETLIGRRLYEKNLGIIDFKKPDLIIKLENIDNMFLISIIKPKEDRLKRSF
ncbi:MAG: THUMP domain-containing protein [Desulfurococcales archaeon]|nr:THUMP domain-containing protein [Desulfurococcales archaeon]